MKNTRSLVRCWLVLVLFMFAATVAPLRAADDTNSFYFPDGKIDVVALLAPPPLFGSSEQAFDLAEVRAVHADHPTNEEAIAWVENAGPSIFNYTSAIGGFFQRGKFPVTEAFFHRIAHDAARPVNEGKNYWKRNRPYVVDPSLADRGPVAGFSYPSGHSTMGTVYALVLAEIFPEKRDAILAVGRNMGWHRVMIAKHFPTDVMAGRVLGQAIFHELQASPQFQHDLEAVKAEINAAGSQ